MAKEIKAVKKIPARQCIGCKEMKAKKDMLRIIKTDDGIELDASGRKNGRGAYICKNKECLKLAIKTKGLERSFKTKVDDNLFDELEKEFEQFE